MKQFNEGETVLVDVGGIAERRATVFVHKYNNVALKFNDTGERDIFHQNKVEPLMREY